MRPKISLLYLAYLLSGFAALVYEIVWARELTHELGASLYAVATVTGLFLGGLALGSAIGGRLFSRAGPGSPVGLRAYAFIQVLVAAFGIIMPVAFRADVQQSLWAALHIADPALSTAARVLFAALLIVPATGLMGATFPALISASRNTADTAERLYTVNTIGGALGAIACGFALLPQVGLQMSSWLAAAIDIAAAAVAFSHGAGGAPALLDVSNPDADETGPGAKTLSASPSRYVVATVLVTAFFSGLLVMVYEIIAARLLSLVLSSSTYSLSAVLSLCISGLALGAYVATRFLLPFRQPLLISAGALTASALYVCLFIYLVDGLPWGFIAIFKVLQSAMPQQVFAVSLLSRLLVAATMVAIPSVFSGMVLPLMLSVFDQSDGGQRVLRAGALYAISGAGCIAGSFLTGFVLIPKLGELFDSGIQTTLVMHVCAQALLSLALFAAWSRSFISDRSTRILTDCVVGVLALAVILDIAFFKPLWDKSMMSVGPSFYSPQDLSRLDRNRFFAVAGATASGSASVLFYREGLNSTITVESLTRNNVLFLKNDGKVEAALPLDVSKPAPTSDLKTQLALAAVPLSASASGSASRDTLLIGYGSGTTAGALVRSPKVSRLTIAELEPAIYACSHFFSAITGDPVKAAAAPDSKMKIVPLLNDGRYVLQSHPGKFDLVVCQPSDPWVNGSSELFTSEFFRLLRSQLSPRGVYCQWIQLYAIDPASFGVLCRSLIGVFPNAVLYHEKDAGECLVLAFNDGTDADTEDFLKQLRLHATVVDSLGINQMCERLAADTGERRTNTDDNLIVEFAAAAGAMTQEPRILENVQWIEKYARQ